MFETILRIVLNLIFRPINKFIPWYRFPHILGLLNIYAFVLRYRRQNLHDTESLTPVNVSTAGQHNTRTSDGSNNDLMYPTMGKAKTRFARNVPLEFAYPDAQPALMTPSPRDVSNALMKRDKFIPATSLNMLAAAWIQFQVHDWFNHSNDATSHWQVPLKTGDSWPGGDPMKVERTLVDPTSQPGDDRRPPAYINNSAHWWDASQIYGSSKDVTDKLRAKVHGKLIIGDDGLLPVDPATGVDVTGFNDNWWIGLSIMHTLFTLEHNAICDELHSRDANLTEDQLFETARLINVAVMAKIHTVEWTPAILNHSSLRLGMRADWWGLLGERIYNRFGRIDGDLLSGYPGSKADHWSGNYAMTEEFVAVYRMHPLLPDDFDFRAVANDSSLRKTDLLQVSFGEARKLLQHMTMADVIYSFGTSHPGAITLHNFPNALRELQPPPSGEMADPPLVDVATIDILRDRERGVPRYNTFRRLVGMAPVKTFADLTDNPAWANEIQQVYNNQIDQVDLMVGLYAEPNPPGFGFSDTAFRIFSLMAPRRLKSDRFFNESYNAEVYHKVGMEWIKTKGTMLSVLERHYPSLAQAMGKMDNAFQRWR